jgi:Uma2 family endonuclease
MTIAIVRKRPFLNVKTFMGFLDSRPDEERWELINGVPMMMASPKMRHQQIASNLEFHLRAALRERKPEWRIYREIGLVADESGHWRPEPEIAVVDADIDDLKSHANRFYLVAEVLSASDHAKYGKQEESVIEAKLDYYQSHEHNRCILIIEQNKPEVTIYRRAADGTWPDQPVVLRSVDDEIVIDEIGRVCIVGDLYADTTIDPRHSARASQ